MHAWSFGYMAYTYIMLNYTHVAVGFAFPKHMHACNHSRERWCDISGGVISASNCSAAPPRQNSLQFCSGCARESAGAMTPLMVASNLVIILQPCRKYLDVLELMETPMVATNCTNNAAGAQMWVTHRRSRKVFHSQSPYPISRVITFLNVNLADKLDFYYSLALPTALLTYKMPYSSRCARAIHLHGYPSACTRPER